MTRQTLACALALALIFSVAIAGAAAAQTPAPAFAPVTAPAATPAAMPPAAQPAAQPAAPMLASAASAQDAAAPAPDLSVRGMVSHASKVVQTVLAVLAAASVMTWTILVAKSVELVRGNRTVRRGIILAEAEVAQAETPDMAQQIPHPLLVMRKAVHAELTASSGTPPDGTKDRLASCLHRLEQRLVRRAQFGTGVLATIGAVSPFVGLFGTVWGIMNSFAGIARLHTTNLAVVAPGIAEALLATAAGLIVAIPAVVIYNLLVRWIAVYRHALGDLGEIVLRHTARGLDRARPIRPAQSRVAAE